MGTNGRRVSLEPGQVREEGLGARGGRGGHDEERLQRETMERSALLQTGQASVWGSRDVQRRKKVTGGGRLRRGRGKGLG